MVAVGAVVGAVLAGGAVTSAEGAAKVPDPTTSTLRQLAKHTGVRIGTAVDTSALAADATYRSAVSAQFDSVTPENVMKWEVVEPERGRYDFTQADALVAAAKANHQKVRGHTLVWHNQLPSWLTSRTWTKRELKAVLKQHIRAEAGRYRGQVWAWDVVNEAFDEDGSLRDSLWLQVIGPEYIEDAFRWAHQADPKALLFYNDYNLESIGPKSDAAYALVKKLRAKGVPVQGVGFQAHLSTQYPFPEDLAANLRRFGRLGVKTAMTEADVRITLPADPAEVNAQSAGYTLLLQDCLLEPSCVSFTVWGFTDRYQWVPQTFPGEGSAAVYDESYRPKPAYDALRRTLALAPRHAPRA
ncbi:endo-1,4-beta-xylanase [Angustibacter aerolatus]